MICPICKSPAVNKGQQCARCGLDLRWVKWRREGIGAICLAITLLIVGFLLSNHAVSYNSYNGLFYQSHVTYPCVGIGSISSFIGVVTIIAGIASTIVYDLKISRYSRKIEAAKGQPFLPSPGEFGGRNKK